MLIACLVVQGRQQEGIAAGVREFLPPIAGWIDQVLGRGWIGFRAGASATADHQQKREKLSVSWAVLFSCYSPYWE